MSIGVSSVVSAALLVLLISGGPAIAESARNVNGCDVADPGSIPIAPGDVLLFGYGSLTQTIVPAHGKVVLPLAGEIQVLGQTPNHLVQLVRERLSKYTNKGAVQLYVEDDGRAEMLWACRGNPFAIVEALDQLDVIRKIVTQYKIRFPWNQILRFNYKEARKGYQAEQILIESET
jgi:hypothetical protein